MKVELFSGKVLPELKKIKTDDTQFPDGGKAKDIFADIARALTPQNKSSSSAIAISHSSANQLEDSLCLCDIPSLVICLNWIRNRYLQISLDSDHHGF